MARVPNPPGVADRDDQLGGGDPVHSRQHNRMLYAEHLGHGGFDHVHLPEILKREDMDREIPWENEACLPVSPDKLAESHSHRPMYTGKEKEKQ